MTTAGRVFCTSPPTDASKVTHQTSPRLTGCIADQPFRPLVSFLFALSIIGHFAITRTQAIGIVLRRGARGLFDVAGGIIVDHKPRGLPARDRVSSRLMFTPIPSNCDSFPVVP